jgi:hypothetical protein
MFLKNNQQKRKVKKDIFVNVSRPTLNFLQNVNKFHFFFPCVDRFILKTFVFYENFFLRKPLFFTKTFVFYENICFTGPAEFGSGRPNDTTSQSVLGHGLWQGLEHGLGHGLSPKQGYGDGLEHSLSS